MIEVRIAPTVPKNNRMIRAKGCSMGYVCHTAAIVYGNGFILAKLIN